MIKQFKQALMDILIINLALFLALVIRFGGTIPPIFLNNILELAFLFTAVKILCFFAMGVYDRKWQHASIGELVGISSAITVAILINIFITYIFYIGHGNYLLPRSILPLSWILTIFLVIASRVSLRYLMDRNFVFFKEIKTALCSWYRNQQEYIAKETSLNPYEVLPRLWQSIPSHIKVTFISTFATGILVHLFMFTNILPNHDVARFANIFHASHSVPEGRWFIFFPQLISSEMSMPWIAGVLSLLYMSIVACFMVACLQIKRQLSCILCGILIVSFPTTGSTFLYIYVADSYFFSLMLASTAAYFANKYKKGFIFAGMLIILSMGIYQAYFSVAAGLMVSMLIIYTLKDEASLKELIVKSSKFLASLAIGMVGYLFMVRLIATELTTYMNIDQMGQVSLSELPSLIYNAYLGTFAFFFLNSFRFHTPIMEVLFLITLIAAIGIIALIVCNKQLYKEKAKLLLLIILLGILPLATNLTHVMNPANVHLLMIYGLVILFIIALALVEIGLQLKKRGGTFTSLASWIVIFTLFFSSLSYATVTNKAYFNQFYVYEQAFAYSIQLISRIQSTEGYSTEKTIYFIGGPVPLGPTLLNRLPELHRFTGTNNFLPHVGWGYTRFLMYYIGFNQRIVGVLDYDRLLELPFYEYVMAMTLYPNDGSILVVDDAIIIKFRDLRN